MARALSRAQIAEDTQRDAHIFEMDGGHCVPLAAGVFMVEMYEFIFGTELGRENVWRTLKLAPIARLN